MRVSNYIIKAKLSDNKYLLFHSYTGALDVVNKKVGEYIENPKKNYIDKESLNTLTKRGYITDKSPREEEKHVLNIVKLLQSKIKTEYVFTIIPTYRCNLKCTYCYQDSIKRDNVSIDKNVVDKIFEIIKNFSYSNNKIFKTIQLFGGEPFLPENYKIIKYILNIGKELGYKFAVSTNGVCLDQYISLLKPKFFKGIQITLDGIENVHNKRRLKKNGTGTFKEIVRNIDIVLSKDIPLNLRVNIDKRNFENFKYLVKYISEKDWTNYPNFQVNFRPVYFVSKNRKKKYGFTNYLLYKKVILLLGKEYLWMNMGNITFPFEPIISDIFRGKGYAGFVAFYCVAQRGSVIFDPYGDLYSCWRTCGEKFWRIGKYIPKLTWEENKLNILKNRTVVDISKCRKCKLALLCGGGCVVKAFDDSRSLYNPGCEDDIEKLLIKKFPIIYNKLKQKNKEDTKYINHFFSE